MIARNLQFSNSIPVSTFHQSREQLARLIAQALDLSRQLGATSAEAEASEASGQSISVRHGEVETIEYNRDKGIGITVYVGQQRGHANTSDFSSQALKETVAKALTIAKQTGADPAAGLPEATWLARQVPNLDLFHPWAISTEEAIETALRCEAAAFAVDSRLNNSEGANLHTQTSQFIYGNTHGFLEGYSSSRHSLSCAMIAEDDNGMERDYWFDTHRVSSSLASAESIGRLSGERTLRRLGARRIPTGKVPVLFEAPVASSLIGHFVSAVSGGALYRKSSFLTDSLGKQLFNPCVTLVEDPFIPQGLASSPFDNEGVAVQRRTIIEAGTINGYFLSTYSARKMGMESTGNAGGNHNLLLGSTGESFEQLLKKMGRGLLVTELMGQGVNTITGDYSRGVAGFWVENGEIAYPVQEITIAGNLLDMFAGIIGVGTDVLNLGSKQTGSILIEQMTVAGE